MTDENGDFTLTGIALTTMGGSGNYDRIELFREKSQAKEHSQLQ